MSYVIAAPEFVAAAASDLAEAQRLALRSQIARIIQHLAKLEYSPSIEPRNGWRHTIRFARLQTQRRIEDNPSQKSELGQFIVDGTRRGIELAIADLEEHGKIDELNANVLQRASFTPHQVLGDWFPAEPHR